MPSNTDQAPSEPGAALHRDDVRVSGEKPLLFQLQEDGWAVLIGSLLILIVLATALLSPGSAFKVPVYQWGDTNDLFGKVLAGPNLLLLAVIGLIFFFLSAFAIRVSGNTIKRSLAGFGVIYILAIISLIIAGNKSINYYGIEYVVFGLIIGLAISNTGAAPLWLRETARSEFFIKTGLVILGAGVLFTDIVKAGVPGMLQALVVVAVVWFFALWIARRLKVDDEFGVILASAVAICGVSAAIVASGAIKGDKKKLSYVTTLVLLVAIPMMIVQPWIIRQFGIPPIVGGAWLGGTLDTTATVTAATQLVGPEATKVGVIIKFSQNVLIGLAAFLIATWWTLKKNPSHANTEKPGLRLVWERFPKFVLGFIAVSLAFSFLVPADTTKQAGGILNSLRTLWFALAFVSIGIEAKFSDLVRMQGGRPALVFILAQLFNILWTLLCAYLLFGGILFPVPDIR